MKYLSNNPEEIAAFDRFSDLMARLMIKHGPAVLKKKHDRIAELLLSSEEIAPEDVSEMMLDRLKAYQKASDQYRKSA